MKAEDLLRLLALVRREIEDYAKAAWPRAVTEATVRTIAAERKTEGLERNTREAELRTNLGRQISQALAQVVRTDELHRTLTARLSNLPRSVCEEEVVALMERQQASVLLAMTDLVRTEISRMPKNPTREDVALMLMEHAPRLLVEVETISHLEHARAEVRREGGDWIIKLYIPVYRDRWMGSGFVAQGLNASGDGTQVGSIKIVTTNYNAAPPGDELILADATAGPITITLPSAAANERRRLMVYRINTNANNVTLSGLISGTPLLPLQQPWFGVTLIGTKVAAVGWLMV